MLVDFFTKSACGSAVTAGAGALLLALVLVLELALDVFGPAPMPVQLLDGVFLAARADTLRRSGVRFDPCFAFHYYYDLDLSRSARRAGLSLGTWPLPLVHATIAGRNSPGCCTNRAAFCN